MTIDWKKSTIEQRKALYRVTREVARRYGLTLEDIYQQAFGDRFAHGEGYDNNFSSGRIARWRSRRIFDWLHRAHSPYAGLLVEELRAADKETVHASGWAEFLAEYGQFELLSCEHVDLEAELDDFYDDDDDDDDGDDDDGDDDKNEEKDEDEEYEKHFRMRRRYPPRARIEPYAYGLDTVVQTRMRLGDPFRFFLNSPRKGVVIGLEWIEGAWFALPLHEGKPVAPLIKGDQALPAPDRSDPTANLLVENGMHGLHRVVMLLLPETRGLALAADLSMSDAIPVSTLNVLASEIRSLPVDDWLACRLNVLFR